MNKAKYKISCIVWYLGKDNSNGIGLRSSAVVSWSASNPAGELMIYRYLLADGASKLESEIFPTPLVAVSRLLDPLKRQYNFADHTRTDLGVTAEHLLSYITSDKRFYYIREKFADTDFGLNSIPFTTGKYFEHCDFSGIKAESIMRSITEGFIPLHFISCNFSGCIMGSNIGLNHCWFDGSNFYQAETALISKCSSFKNCNFQSAQLSELNFIACNASGSSFKDAAVAKFAGVGSIFRDCIFDNVSLSSENNPAEMKHSDFSRASMKNAYLLGAKFYDTILKGTDLGYSYLKNCDFTGSTHITNQQLYDFASKDADEYTFTGVDGETITVP